MYVSVQPMFSEQSCNLQSTRGVSDPQPSTTSALGRLSLVSLGVGDPDHMTLRALERIQQADSVLVSSLLAENYAGVLKGKKIFDAGHGLFSSLCRRQLSADEGALIDEQEEKLSRWINTEIQAGRNLVILEMGDPFFFGPQIGYLSAFSHLKPEVVPGISSINAANAALALSLLDGERSVRIGHWSLLEKMEPATQQEIRVLFCMGLDLTHVFELLSQQYPPGHPLSLVIDAGFQHQRVISGSVASLTLSLKHTHLPWACLIYLGVCKDESDY